MGERGERDEAMTGVDARTDGGVGVGEAQAALDLGPPPAGADLAPAFPVARPAAGGRPKGALNRKTLMLKRYFQAKQIRDPAVYLGELQSADPLQLLAWFREHDKDGGTTLMDVVRLQAAAGRDLMPYLHSKMPQQVDIGTDKMAVMVFGGETRSDEEILDDVMSIEDGVIDID